MSKEEATELADACARELVRRLKAENEKLRKAVEAAPHDFMCKVRAEERLANERGWAQRDVQCTCWKVKA